MGMIFEEAKPGDLILTNIGGLKTPEYVVLQIDRVNGQQVMVGSKKWVKSGKNVNGRHWQSARPFDPGDINPFNLALRGFVARGTEMRYEKISNGPEIRVSFTSRVPATAAWQDKARKAEASFEKFGVQVWPDDNCYIPFDGIKTMSDIDALLRFMGVKIALKQDDNP